MGLFWFIGGLHLFIFSAIHLTVSFKETVWKSAGAGVSHMASFILGGLGFVGVISDPFFSPNGSNIFI